MVLPVKPWSAMLKWKAFRPFMWALVWRTSAAGSGGVEPQAQRSATQSPAAESRAAARAPEGRSALIDPSGYGHRPRAA